MTAQKKVAASNKLGRSSLIFAALTLISRFFGLLRDMLVARYFETAISDSFFAALRIPNTLRRFFGEGGFANAFVPVFTATKTRSPEELRDLLQFVFGTLLAILLLITALGMIFAGQIIFVVAHGFSADAQQFALTQTMLRIMFPYILLISLTALAGGVLNSYGKFAAPAFTPVLLNVAIIIACLWRSKHGTDGAKWYGLELAWAVLIGGGVQLLFQIPFLWQIKMLVIPKWGITHVGVRKILRLMLPTLFGSSIGQLSVLFNTFLASMFATGSISWLYYSDRMVELPVALVGVALGTVILPRLSALKASDDIELFATTLSWALRMAIVVGSAFATGLLVLAPALLATFFYGGVFAKNDVIMSALSLRAYALSAFFLILVKVLAPAFYARHDTKTPVRAGVTAMIVSIIAALILGNYLQHVGLALASTLATATNVGLLLYFLTTQSVPLPRNNLNFYLQIVAANAAMALTLLYLQQDLQLWLNSSAWWRFGHLLTLVAIGGVVYALTLLALGLRFRHLRLRTKL